MLTAAFHSDATQNAVKSIVVGAPESELLARCTSRHRQPGTLPYTGIEMFKITRNHPSRAPLNYVALTSGNFLRDSAMRERADEREIYSRCCGGIAVYPGFPIVRYIMRGCRLKWTRAEIGTGARVVHKDLRDLDDMIRRSKQVSGSVCKGLRNA